MQDALLKIQKCSTAISFISSNMFFVYLPVPKLDYLPVPKLDDFPVPKLDSFEGEPGLSGRAMGLSCPVGPVLMGLALSLQFLLIY